MILQLDNAALRKASQALYQHMPAPGRLHVFGVRSASPHGKTAVEVHAPQFDRFDDTLGVFGTAFVLWPGTTDPGSTWTHKPMNPQGAAHLIPGVWQYRKGLHRSKPALIQAAPVTVRRDRDRDGSAEAGEPLDRGYFGLNIHRMGNGGPTVASWSAGCQGAAEKWFLELLRLVDASGQAAVEYILFDGPALVRVLS